MFFWGLFLFIFFHSNIRALFCLPFCASKWLEMFWTSFLNIIFIKNISEICQLDQFCIVLIESSTNPVPAFLLHID